MSSKRNRPQKTSTWSWPAMTCRFMFTKYASWCGNVMFQFFSTYLLTGQENYFNSGGCFWNCLDDISAVVLPKVFLAILLGLESCQNRRRRQPSSPDREITTQLFFDFIQGLSLASCSCSSSVWLQEWLFAKKRCIFCLFSLHYLYVHVIVQQYMYRRWTP